MIINDLFGPSKSSRWFEWNRALYSIFETSKWETKSTAILPDRFPPRPTGKSSTVHFQLVVHLIFRSIISICITSTWIFRIFCHLNLEKNTNRIGLIGPMLRQLIARGSHGNPSVGSAFKIDMLISNRFVELGLFLATGWHFWHVLTRPPSAKTRGKNPISSRKFGPKNVALLLKFNIWKKCSGWTGEWKEFQLSWRSRRRDGADKEAERGECRRQVPSRGWIIPG